MPVAELGLMLFSKDGHVHSAGAKQFKCLAFLYSWLNGLLSYWICDTAGIFTGCSQAKQH